MLARGVLESFSLQYLFVWPAELQARVRLPN